MPDHNPDVLKCQAEAALRRLEEARLHERCAKACKSCSQKHRKCQYKSGHYPKCDLCAKNNRECEVIPSPLAHTRRSGDTGSPTSQTQQYPGNYSYSGTPASASGTLERSRRSSSGAYVSGSPTGSPVDARGLSDNSPSSYAYPQGGVYPYSPASTTQIPSTHAGAHSSSQNQHAQYSQYTSGQSSTAHQGREPNAYYASSQTSSSFIPSSTQWSETHGTQTQSAIGQGYGYPATSSAARQDSASSVPQIHTGPGQTYIRTSHGYQVASPASPGSSYALPGNPMYHISPQNVQATRYSTGPGGQGYDQSLNGATSDPSNGGGMYYQ